MLKQLYYKISFTQNGEKKNENEKDETQYLPLPVM